MAGNAVYLVSFILEGGTQETGDVCVWMANQPLGAVIEQRYQRLARYAELANTHTDYNEEAF